MNQSNYDENLLPKRVKLTFKQRCGDAKGEKTELPFKMLVMGNYQGANANVSFRERTSINIDKNNFNRVMHTASPRLKATIPNYLLKTKSGSSKSQDLALNIFFRAMEDFHPDNIICQEPSLRRLYKLRKLLVDLKIYPDKYEQIIDQMACIAMGLIYDHKRS